MPSKPSNTGPVNGTNATVARLMDVASEGGTRSIQGMTAYSSFGPSHAWAVFYLGPRQGYAVAYIRDEHQWAIYKNLEGDAHSIWVEVSRSMVARRLDAAQSRAEARGKP